LTWAIDEELIMGKNPYLSLKPMKAISKEDRVKPFSKAEVKIIVDASGEHYPGYSAFIRFLFMTGVMTGKAIALQWKHIDFEYGQIKICESLSVDKAGNGYQRVRKGAKTGATRYLPISRLSGFLCSIEPKNPHPDDLMFPGPIGNR
jgi:integrase